MNNNEYDIVPSGAFTWVVIALGIAGLVLLVWVVR